MAKQRQIRVEQGLPQNLMEEMQDRSDEQLESETKHRSIALALLGARAAERYDAATARTYFQRAIAASRPQERMQIRRMADASLALAERRADDLKHAVEKLGGEAPSGRALMGLRLMGLIVPPPGGSVLLKVRGFAILAALVIAILAAGLGVVELVSLPFGGIGLAPGLLLGLIVVGVALAVLAFVGKRKQAAARAAGKGAGSPSGKGGGSASGKGGGSASGKGTASASASAKAKLTARAKAKATGPAKAKVAPAASGSKASKRTATTTKGSADKPPAAATSGRGSATTKGASANGAGTARRGGAARGTGTAKGAAAAKPARGDAPAKGGTPAKRPKPPARPKRPSR
jgi:hypothetical protein